MAKVDCFLVVAELPRKLFNAFAAIPKFKVVLVDANFQLQAEILLLPKRFALNKPPCKLGDARQY